MIYMSKINHYDMIITFHWRYLILMHDSNSYLVLNTDSIFQIQWSS